MTAPKFELWIDCDNAAFDPTVNEEVARLLRVAADNVEAGELTRKLRDVNGNSVGGFRFVPDKDA